MALDQVGIGIVGSGFIAGAHAEAFARVPRATVRAVASRTGRVELPLELSEQETAEPPFALLS